MLSPNNIETNSGRTLVSTTSITSALADTAKSSVCCSKVSTIREARGETGHEFERQDLINRGGAGAI